ncbi:hypothetical protein PTE30175_05609 [Pandoraea terrae]|uniref:Uncharacterized protein n=2 Tax=Pandoraea terrae TaxID=1537710 RepID=A0A5E4ZGR1_9BURK|nr:hypothetical protein PTE30175_05609 [Pandoraea terrae]
MVGKDLTRVVPHANILPHINGTVTLDYVLQRAAGGPPEPSIPLTLEVNRTAASLPKATVTEAVNDVLDPRDAPNGAEVVIAWHSLMQAGDTVVLEWQGAGEPGSDTQEKLLFGNDVGHPIRFTVPYAKVKPNDGTTVQVSYRVEHDDNVIADSEVLDLAVVQPALPAASVDEAANDLLNPDDMPGGATVRIPVAARLRAGDVVIIQWTGSEDDGTTTVSRTIRPEDVGRDLTETVALRYVQANVGGTVTLEYAIDRALTDDEESPPSVYDVRRELGSGDLLVMGARFNRSMYRASSAPRYLSALNRQTHAPLRAEWQYDGETNWTAGTTFRDTQPHLLLRVRSATDEGTINPANFIGTGSDSTTADLAAFVAHLDAGNVYGWGNATNGGDIPSTIITMDDIVEVTSTSSACSARRINHRVVAWGVADTGGSGVPNDMDAEAVVGNFGAMAARLTNGSVAAWGSVTHGVTVPPDIGALRDVKRIVAAGAAFALIHGAGQISQVKAWGNADAGGTVPPDIGTLTDIVDVCGNGTCFLALRGNGHVVAWGRADYGATVPGDVAVRNDILEMCASTHVFAVRTGDGHVMAWGNPTYQDNIVPDDIKTLSDIVELSATWGAFCARRANGHVVAWGSPNAGGKMPTDIALLDDIVQVTGSGGAFAATRRNGTVVAWGDPLRGGDTTPVAAQLTDVRAVYANTEAFVALTTDRRVVAWGTAGGGGDNAEIWPLRGKISYQATPASRGHALRINRARAKAASAILETA